MRHMALLLFSALLLGCAVSREAGGPEQYPELIQSAPLPPLGAFPPSGGIRMDVVLHIRADGTVDSARVMGSSGDPDWDSVAVLSMKKWLFTPPRQGDRAVDVWMRQMLVVQVCEPAVMTIGELASPTERGADSLHSVIKSGTDFDTLMEAALGDPSSGLQAREPREVDLAIYPQHVRVVLEKLDEGQVTRPIRVGESFVLYKRYR